MFGGSPKSRWFLFRRLIRLHADPSCCNGLSSLRGVCTALQSYNTVHLPNITAFREWVRPLTSPPSDLHLRWSPLFFWASGLTTMALVLFHDRTDQRCSRKRATNHHIQSDVRSNPIKQFCLTVNFQELRIVASFMFRIAKSSGDLTRKRPWTSLVIKMVDCRVSSPQRDRISIIFSQLYKQKTSTSGVLSMRFAIKEILLPLPKWRKNLNLRYHCQLISWNNLS